MYINYYVFYDLTSMDNVLENHMMYFTSSRLVLAAMILLSKYEFELDHRASV